MAKLYPPKLEATIPAMLKDLSTNDNLILTVPFHLNEAVSLKEVTAISLLIKTVSTGIIKDTLVSSFYQEDTSSSICYATFILNREKYQIGQYYKIQIAFMGENSEIGYYSSVGIVKCTSKPDVFIKGFNITNNNTPKHTYTGIYQQTEISSNLQRDFREKVYSYCFTIYDSQGNIFDTSGIQLHNTNLDVDKDQSFDTWSSNKSLLQDINYTITYKVTTINGAVISSSNYKMNLSSSENDPYIMGSFNATWNYEDAYVNLHIGKVHESDGFLSNNYYVVLRASSEDNFEAWYEFLRFQSNMAVENPHLGNDYTVAQGVQYRYKIQELLSNGAYSKALEAKYFLSDADESNNKSVDKFFVEFEHAYLSDGERQLCIRYNPKVASFKSTLLESKMDTLGGKYPFIFRNGRVEYKEFSISGLISALMDPTQQFFSAAADPKIRRAKTASIDNINYISSTSLERDNFRAEREFKLEVLKWLTNGSIKLFRSPGEGNYIVRLMNVSMSPNDTLSRMLHTFTCTAYEVADYTLANLKQYQLIKTAENNVPSEIMFDEVMLSSIFQKASNTVQDYSLAIYGGARYLEFKNQYSDLILQITYMDGTNTSFNVGNSSGGYLLANIDMSPVINISYISGNFDNEATVVIGYYGESPSLFNTVTNPHVVEQDVVQQFIGMPDMNEMNLITDIIEADGGETGVFYLIQVMPKTIVTMIENNGEWYHAIKYDNEISMSDQAIDFRDATVLYYDIAMDKYYCGSLNNPLNGLPNYHFTLNNTYYSSLATVNNGIVLTNGQFDSIRNVAQVDTLRIGDGLLCNVVYVLKTISRQ